MSETTIFRLKIKGAVQGVGYRDWAIAEAKARGLDGWVRNRSDGSVEVLIAGPNAKVTPFQIGALPHESRRPARSETAARY